MTSDGSVSPQRKLLVQGGLLLALLLFLAWDARPDGRLHITFFPTNGDAALIHLPDGRFILIDGGADPAGLTAALGRRLPFWRRSLDMVILTLPDRAHLPGQVAALARYRADLVFAAPSAEKNPTLDEWHRLINQTGSALRVARVGDQLVFGKISVHVLALGDGKRSGLIVRLHYGTTSVVFAHSAAATDEQQLAERGIEPTTLLAFPWEREPHKGFIQALHPQAIVFTDGYQSEHPIEQSFAQRSIGSAKLFHEQVDGTIEWVSDGQTAQVVTER